MPSGDLEVDAGERKRRAEALGHSLDVNGERGVRHGLPRKGTVRRVAKRKTVGTVALLLALAPTTAHAATQTRDDPSDAPAGVFGKADLRTVAWDVGGGSGSPSASMRHVRCRRARSYRPARPARLGRERNRRPGGRRHAQRRRRKGRPEPSGPRPNAQQPPTARTCPARRPPRRPRSRRRSRTGSRPSRSPSTRLSCPAASRPSAGRRSAKRRRTPPTRVRGTSCPMRRTLTRRPRIPGTGAATASRAG